ncbi:class I SAM-dependent methyltransferase [Pseudorhodoplanes sinuspersici]|uniref:Uncharacterized protein n=1 Tax=Pseudorhodoplanes sinuspersici TaxID=1235591 RepID=A0A1W6ZKQ0_9HYPH|nr:class I SAM-dependent methyltransferase [Pseudorhodoplanes sinuspersici]ARP97998.1 hypothetical protein CAK95_02070 [Pseudorhodoplanes sinuspersici]RKE68248.1 methyltransferase family protein [Pseudorhodoplanes sinuspersici]
MSGFEDAAWLFTSNVTNRGILGQDFNEAALLWKATRASQGPILEVGRRHGGSTVLLLMASDSRHITSIDSNPRHLPESDKYFQRPEVAKRLTLLTDTTHVPVVGTFGFLFIQGDDTYEGVKADVIAQWDSLQPFGVTQPSVVLHDAVPSNQGENGGSPSHCGVKDVCNELVQYGAAEVIEAAGSSLWLRKLSHLPKAFRGSTPTDVFESAKILIAELRNRREPEKNWNAFRTLIELNCDTVTTTFSSRWLVSICDTYADYAEPKRSRNALLISLLFNMIRVSDSLYESKDIRGDRIDAIKNDQLPLFDGFVTLHLDKQDTFLNLAKRLTKALSDDKLLYGIFVELLERAKRNDNLLSRFAGNSARPDLVLPLNALEIADNYGIR